MASSGTFADSTGDLRLEIDWRIVSTDVAKNQSVVEAKVYMRTRWAIYWSATRTGSVTVNGTKRTYSHGNVTTVNYERKLMATEEFTVGHNNDGTKSVAMSATFPINFTYNGSYYTNITISGTAVLDAIPRATTMSAASFSSNLSPSTTRTLNLTLSIKSTSFRHDVILRDGTHELKKLTNQSSPTSVSLTTTDVNKIINRMSTVTSKNFTVEVITKTTTNGTVIGTVSRSVKATLNSSTTSPTVSSKSATVRGSGYDSTINKFVRTVSSANVSFTASAGYGASISSMSASINNGGTLSGSRSGSTWTGTTGTFSNSGTYTVTLSVTNSRGQKLTSTQTISISVLDYSPPTVSDFSAKRASSGTGVTVYRRSGFSNTSGLNNARKITIYRKRTNTTSWGTAIDNIAFHSTYNNGELRNSSDSVSRSLSYNYRIEVEDRFGNIATSEFTLGTESVLMSFNKDIGVGIGKIHERGALDIQGDVYVNGEDLRTVPFQTATLTNGWYQSTLAGYGDIGYYKRAGIVYLSGMIRHDSPIYRQGLFTLPTGFRPGEYKRIHLDSAPSGMRIIILTSGLVRLETSALSNGVTWADLSTVSFPAGR